MPNGGQILVKSLAAHGVDRVFCVAGESYLPVLDAFLDYPEIEVITCRHESGATFMAEAYAQLTGKAAVAMVTRGPGACNGSIGIHAARQSSTPVILFSGLIGTADRDKEAFQEFDLPQMFGSLSKWAVDIPQNSRIAEYVARAFQTAQCGRPGPVVVGLPEETVFDEAPQQTPHVVQSSLLQPNPEDIAALEDILRAADKPLIIVGGSGWDDNSVSDLEAFSSAAHIPVAAALRRQDLFHHNHGSYIGELGFGTNPKLVARIKAADVVIALGTRLDEITQQGYQLFQSGQKLVHIYPAAEEFGKSTVPYLAMHAHPGPVVSTLAGSYQIDGRGWAAWRDEARQDYLDWTSIEAQDRPWKGADMTKIFDQLRDVLQENAIVTTDAGNFSGWAQRYLRYGRPGRMLSPVAGAMGYGVPAAVAGSLYAPDRTVLGICGDGGFMMTGQELATAIHHRAKPVIMICNNGMYGTIRMHQERDFPGRISATGLTNPDFVKLAESYGAYGARISHESEFANIWEEAVNQDRPAVLEIVQDPRQISTQSKI